MKKYFLFILHVFSVPLWAQRGNEFLVYTVNGHVTALYNSLESAVKIGKILKPGTTITMKQGARMTMVCKQGKPLPVTKEGSFPINNWKDSCKMNGNSMTSNYFKYIWNEFYTRSDEYQAEQKKGKDVNAVTRSPAPRRFEFRPNRVKIEFSPGLDTLNYASGNFLLSWVSYNYSGKYLFTLFNTSTGRVLYKDSLHRSFITIDKFVKLLEPGTRYAWTITAQKGGIIKRRILNFVAAETVEKYIAALQRAVDVPEDSAAQFFRIGYMLEQGHYLAEAFIYYKKAADADPEIQLYNDKMLRFKSEFWIND
ncbi:MAG: tetratricopeptide repeat protein [Chitinophagaceae bacterium]|nr:tetratricopeptide repeat protein [Chitinophagaceae bacterium]MBK9570236.1 tetratricopeptide repeat protein [Chitinophagaceae bacterium]MBL0273318.1 tetratricopeptide repeat protein [Chitinophagaceae bacterium]